MSAFGAASRRRRSRQAACAPVPHAARGSAASSEGRATVADRPIAVRPGDSVRSRARSSASRSPRLLEASACSSSRMTMLEAAEQLGRAVMRQHQRDLLRRGEQNVGRQRRAGAARREAGVSPVRVSSVIGSPISATGVGQVAGDVDGERLERRDIERVDAARAVLRRRARSRSTRLGRKPASVLPPPVGAISSVSRPCPRSVEQARS